MKKAFTLAEVFTTLAIVGVIASMTIPSLVQNNNKTQYVVGLKKAYSTMSQVVMRYKADHGMSLDSAFANIAKKCDSATGCLYNTEIKFLGGTVERANYDATHHGLYAKAILKDGLMIVFRNDNGTCQTDSGDDPLNEICCIFFVDVNGAKPPNTRGREFFAFWMTKSGIYPRGSYNDGYLCNFDSSSNGGCAAKVLSEGDMNY